MIIEGERAFPYYTVDVRVQVDGTPPPGWDRAVVLGKPDRMWTRTGRRSPLFYLEKPSIAVLDDEAQKFWEAVKDKNYDAKSRLTGPMFPNYSDVEIKIGEEKWGTWIPDWFNHVTFRLGRTDAEIMASFTKFVNRIERDNGYGSEKTRGLLMGAEDRYRWSGDKGSPAPCTCDFCQNSGLTRVNH